MTSITQKIENFIGGISQQPYEKQIPGSVKDALNVVPDIKGILGKRPGSELVGTLSDNIEGKWHHYYRSETEQYFIRIRPDGQVDAWDALTGRPNLVRYSPTPIDLDELKVPVVADDAKGICDACVFEDYRDTEQDLHNANNDLQDLKNEIQDIYIQLENDDLTEAERAQLEEDLAALESQIPALLQAYDDALAAFEPVATNCGIYNNPYSRATKAACDPTNALDYFKHENDSDLQLTTINDFTFVTNRGVTAQMDSGVDPAPKPAAFLYLNQLEASVRYTVNFWDDEPPTPDDDKSILQASSLSLRSNYQSINGNGSPSATDTVIDTINGITYRLEVQRVEYCEGQQCPDNYWNAQVYLVSTDPTVESGVGITPDWSVESLGRGWTIYVDGDRTFTSSADATISVGPYAVPGSNNTTLDAQEILTDLKGAFETNPDTMDKVNVSIIGNGLFIESKDDKDFVIESPAPELITTINAEVNNVTLLPTQCKDGYVVKVVNSFIEEDDYYVKFVAQKPSTGPVGSEASVGVWEETYKPGILTDVAWETMPHAIRRLPDRTFEVSPVKWASREVGDDITNPIPSIFNQKINKVIFFRNRFIFLAGENIIMSRANEYFNLWASTAQTVSDADPIDLLVASTYPSILYDALETSGGLLLLASNQQFLVVTDNTDIFSPKTASVKTVGTYKYNAKVRPVHMGQTVGFLNDAGYRSRFFELQPNRDMDLEAFESSKPVDQLMPKDLNLIADSKDVNMLAFSVKGQRTVWIYRYFTVNERRVQSAWFKWELSGDILYHAIMDDKYFAVLNVPTGNPATPNIVTLQEFALKLDRDNYLINPVGQMRDYDYQVHLDNYFMVTPSEMNYDPDTKTTTWRLPIGYHNSIPIITYELMYDKVNNSYIATGRYAEVTWVGVTNGVIVTAPGDWTKNHALCGYNFDMKVQLPTIFVTKQKAADSYSTDTRGSLVLHRAHVNFDATGVCDVTVERKGREPYTIGYEATIQDGYISDSAAVEQDVTRTIPIYDRNTNTEIFITSTHPTPTNVVSVDWEGDYNPRYYRRV